MYYHQCYLFSAFFQRVICSPIVPGFIAMKGTYPKPPPLFVFQRRARARARKDAPAYEANHQKSVILSLLVPTSITKMPAPRRNFPPPGVICAGTSRLRSSPPLVRLPPEKNNLSRSLFLPPSRDLDLLLSSAARVFAVFCFFGCYFTLAHFVLQTTKFVSRAHR